MMTIMVVMLTIVMLTIVMLTIVMMARQCDVVQIAGHQLWKHRTAEESSEADIPPDKIGKPPLCPIIAPPSSG